MQRAKFEMASKAVRHAMTALDKQNFTLTLRGEAYAEKMLCDQAPLERCPGSTLAHSRPPLGPNSCPILAPASARHDEAELVSALVAQNLSRAKAPRHVGSAVLAPPQLAALAC